VLCDRLQLSQVSFSHGISFRGDFVGVVDQTVQDGACKGGVADEVMPVFDRELADDHCGSRVIPIFCDFEEIVTVFVVERDEAPVVEDEEVCFGEGGEEPGITAIRLGDVKFGEEPWQTDVLGGAAFAAGLLSEGAGEIAFAATGGAGLWVMVS